MTWRNAITLESEFGTGEFRQQAADLYTLSRFYSQALPSRDYCPPRELSNAIVVTPAAAEYIELARTQFPEARAEELTFAAFVKFFHHDIWIDPIASDTQRILQFLDDDILGSRIRFPWIFKHELYDRFFDSHPPYTERLSEEDTDTLLEGTPAGVFQLRDKVVGPFGVLSSLALR
jgi:hypothetical protein